MTQNQRTDKSGPSTSAGAWDLRHPGLIMKDGEREVHEFTGMWPLKPDADLVKFTKTLAFRYFWNLMDGEVINRGRQLCPELCAILDINFRQTAISSPPTTS